MQKRSRVSNSSGYEAEPSAGTSRVERERRRESDRSRDSVTKEGGHKGRCADRSTEHWVSACDGGAVSAEDGVCPLLRGDLGIAKDVDGAAKDGGDAAARVRVGGTGGVHGALVPLPALSSSPMRARRGSGGGRWGGC